MTFHSQLDHKGSELIRYDENQALFGYLELCDSYVSAYYMSLGAGVAQLLRAKSPGSKQWTESHAGVVTIAKDFIQNAYFIRLYDLHRGMLWEQKLNSAFELRSTGQPQVLTFEGDEYVYGLNFASKDEAWKFKNAVNDRKNIVTRKKIVQAPTQPEVPPVRPAFSPIEHKPPFHQPPINAFSPKPVINTTTTQGILPHTTPSVKSNSSPSWFEKVKGGISKKKSENKKTKPNKADISNPTDFQHLAHVGWNISKGINETFGSENPMDDTVRQLLIEIGYRPETMNKEDLEFVYGFVDDYDGIEAVRESMAVDNSNTRSIAPPSRESPKPCFPTIVPPRSPTRPAPLPVLTAPKFATPAQPARPPVSVKKAAASTIPQQFDMPVSARSAQRKPAPPPVFITDIRSQRLPITSPPPIKVTVNEPEGRPPEKMTGIAAALAQALDSRRETMHADSDPSDDDLSSDFMARSQRLPITSPPPIKVTVNEPEGRPPEKMTGIAAALAQALDRIRDAMHADSDPSDDDLSSDFMARSQRLPITSPPPIKVTVNEPEGRPPEKMTGIAAALAQALDRRRDAMHADSTEQPKENSVNPINKPNELIAAEVIARPAETNFSIYASSNVGGNCYVLPPLQQIGTENIDETLTTEFGQINIREILNEQSESHEESVSSRRGKTDLQALITLEEKVIDEIRVFELPIKGEKIGKGATSSVYEFKIENGTRTLKTKQMNLPTVPHKIAGKKIGINLFNMNAGEKGRLQGHLNPALNEIKILHKLDHKHIVRFFGCFWDSNQLIIFMELMFESVKAKIIDTGLPESVCLNYLWQTANALHYLHSRRPKAVIHRDIKCENLLLNKEGVVKLTDFGLSFLLTVDSTSLTRVSKAPSSVVGTYLFMAPEVLRDMENPTAYGRKSDIWSLGCTVVQMLTGEPPLQKEFLRAGQFGFNKRADSAEHWLQYSSASLVPKASEGLKILLDSMFTFDPQKRPPINEVLSVVQWIMEQNDMLG